MLALNRNERQKAAPSLMSESESCKRLQNARALPLRRGSTRNANRSFEQSKITCERKERPECVSKAWQFLRHHRRQPVRRRDSAERSLQQLQGSLKRFSVRFRLRLRSRDWAFQHPVALVNGEVLLRSCRSSGVGSSILTPLVSFTLRCSALAFSVHSNPPHSVNPSNSRARFQCHRRLLHEVFTFNQLLDDLPCRNITHFRPLLNPQRRSSSSNRHRFTDLVLPMILRDNCLLSSPMRLASTWTADQAHPPRGLEPLGTSGCTASLNRRCRTRFPRKSIKRWNPCPLDESLL